MVVLNYILGRYLFCCLQTNHCGNLGLFPSCSIRGVYIHSHSATGRRSADVVPQTLTNRESKNFPARHATTVATSACKSSCRRRSRGATAVASTTSGSQLARRVARRSACYTCSRASCAAAVAKLNADACRRRALFPVRPSSPRSQTVAADTRPGRIGPSPPVLSGPTKNG